MRTLFFDVDTQLDFVFPGGALYVPGAEEIVQQLAALTRFAIQNGIQIISTADAHTEDDPEFKIWKPHCVAGTTGQTKIGGTIGASPLVLSSMSGAFSAVESQLQNAKQILIEKQHIDCFTNPNLNPLLAICAAERYVVYGVVTEVCVRCAAFGLLRTGARVELVTDAVKSLSPSEETDMLAQFQAAGGFLTTTKTVISGGA